MPKVFDLIRIHSIELKNRMVVAPMFTNLASEHGYVTPLLTEGYRRQAEGGAGLVIVEAACVHPRGRGNFARRLGIEDARCLPGLEELSSTIKRAGACAAIQIHHARLGTRGGSDAFLGAGSLAFEDLSDDQIGESIRAYAQGALRAQEAGFDAVEVHACHGCLLHQFLSPRVNKRIDPWGQDRLLFNTRVIRAIKEAVGPDYPLIWRISADEGIEGGFRLEDTVTRHIPAFEEAGVDIFHVSTGSRSSMEARASEVPPLYAPMGGILRQARAVKERSRVPVIAVGKLMHPQLVASVVERGIADLVALGRPILADPDFPRKLLENREKEIRKCIGCNYCYTRVASKNLAIRCTVNAERGREIENRRPSSPGARRVIVVGGGPAGMEAARLFAGKGYPVLLFEQERELGGLLRLGGSIPRLYTRNLLHILEFQKGELSRLGVELKLGMRVSAGQIRTLEADVLVLATGSEYRSPDIEGVHSAPVLRLDEYLKKPSPLGATVLVLGGREGAEISISLARQGKRVILVHDGEEETLGRAIYMKDPIREYYVKKYLRETQVVVLVNAAISKLDGNSAWIRTVNGDEKSLHFDHLIVATDRFSQKDLAGGLAGFQGKIYSIGDCVSPRSVTEAIDDAWFVAGRNFLLGCMEDGSRQK